jgi:hypothetical protein
MKYRIEISGRGGEIVVGKVSNAFYSQFEEEDLSFSDYAWNDDFFDENEEVDIPEDSRPFEPGCWYDADNVAHEYGVSFDSCYITVSTGDTVVLDNGDATLLENKGVTVEVEEVYPQQMLPDGQKYFVVQSFEKGFFFSYEFEAETFELSKLQLNVVDVDGWELLHSVSYDGQDLEDLGELSTTGKGSEAWLAEAEAN